MKKCIIIQYSNMRSHNIISAFSILLVVIVATISNATATFVDVQVRRITSKRSDTNVDNLPPSSFSINVNGPSGHSILNLAVEPPSTSVFSKNFKYTVAKEDEDGNASFIDESPSQEILREIEDQIYINKETDSAISIKKQNDPEKNNGYQVHGILNNQFAIIPAAEGISLHQMIPLVDKKSIQDQSEARIDNDFIDLQRNITHPKFTTRASTTISAQPEVWVIFDYENSQLFGQDRAKILDYLGVLFHAINNRYATIQNPSISFRISGVTTISSRSSQPFIENNIVPDGSGSDINSVLDDFSIWASTNQANGPKFDMAAIISGYDLQTKNSNGVYMKSVTGLAYLNAACWKTTSRIYATSVTEDRGGKYDGMFNIAHEFAHNLGAPHDGSGKAVNCSWEDGYIMSYKGWGTRNKFLFSPCSINLMKNYISSTQGSCVKSIQASTNIPISRDDVGDRFNMTTLCVMYTNQAGAFPEPTKTGDELCKNLVCRYPTPGKPVGYFSIATLNHPPGDNSPCGTNNAGKCVNGYCVVNIIA